MKFSCDGKSNAFFQRFCKLLGLSGLKSSSYRTFDVTGIELRLACPFPLICTNPGVVLSTTQVLGAWFIWNTHTGYVCMGTPWILEGQGFYITVLLALSQFSQTPFISAASSLRCYPISLSLLKARERDSILSLIHCSSLPPHTHCAYPPSFRNALTSASTHTHIHTHS